MKKIVVYCLCLLLLIMPMLTLTANACEDAYFPFTWADNVNTKAFSVRFGIPKYLGDSHTYSAVGAWRNISPNIAFHSCTFTEEGAMANDKDINIHEAILPGSTIGYTHLYKKNILGLYSEVDANSNVKVAQARIDIGLSLTDADPEWRAKVITHEIGHALGLSHPTAVGCLVPCVMQQGIDNDGWVSKTVNQHDKNNLIKKWSS